MVGSVVFTILCHRCSFSRVWHHVRIRFVPASRPIRLSRKFAMCGNIRFTWFSFLLSAILSAASPPSDYPAEFAVGDVQTVTVITISMAVGSTEHEVKRVTYAPPPGWYVRSHR